MSNMEELANSLNEIVSKMLAENTKKSSELSKVDKEVNDLCHYIEFEDLSASKGFKAYKELQSTLRSRREIKNDMKIFSDIKSTVPGIDKVPQAFVSTMLSTNNQTYQARVREDLFDNEDDADFSCLGSYLTMTFNAKSKKQNHSFKGIQEAVDYIAPAATNQRVKVQCAKSIIKAALSNNKYAAYMWSIPAMEKSA